MNKENKQMVELSDEELLDMVGGFASTSNLDCSVTPPLAMKYGIKIPLIDNPDNKTVMLLYGVFPQIPLDYKK